jgi:lipopolysaccharide biosynthesis glycosyltransferase
MVPRSIWIGFDPREATAFAVAKYSIRQFDRYIPINGVVLSNLQERGLYTREMREGINSDGRRKLIDVQSIRDDYDGAISTEHANARFLVPHLAKVGWALFVDCDVMALDNIERLFTLADPTKALMCVHHDYHPAESMKMDGQLQTDYPRKNQSSVMLINCDHPANRALTLDVVNTWPGRDLHAFKWLPRELIGELPPEWNYLVGVSKLPAGVKPSIVHFTRGLPDMAGYERQEYAHEWRAMVPRAVGAL